MVRGRCGTAVTFVLLGVISLASSLTCREDQVQCKSGGCVDRSRLCDGVLDCSDGSDENDCHDVKCVGPNWFKCSDDWCISSAQVCDGEPNCPDGSDESANCSGVQQSGTTCAPNEFMCADGECINNKWVCDGVPECRDGSDETKGCENFECIDGFRCKNSHCIVQEFHCDGSDDCGDNSDEEGCPTIFHPPDRCPVDRGFFLCADRIACIEEREVCDGMPQCFDKSDEVDCLQQKLNDSYCASLGCTHGCHLSPHNAVNCTCKPGYELAGDRKTCVDVNECEEFGWCHQKCKNLIGGYECSCDDAYILQKDNKTCKASGGDALLLFSSYNRIRGIYLQSQVYFTVAKDLSHVIGVSHSGHHVYWTDITHGEVSIVRATESGSDMEILVDSGLGIPEDIAVDYVTNNIYFTDAIKKHIGVCNETGTACAVLNNEDIDKPRAIALYPQKGVMYWSDWGKVPMIATSGMDGSNPKPLVYKDLDWPNGLALDISNDRLYWVDAKDSRRSIETVRLDGTDRRVILNKAVRHPFSVAIFEDMIYWSDWEKKEIQKCNKFTGKNHSLVVRERKKSYIHGVHIYHPVLYPRVENPCIGNRCSDLCLLSPNASYSCACQEHSVLGADLHTCNPRSKPLQVAVGGDSKILLLTPHRLGRQSTTEIALPDVSAVGCMAFESLNGTIIISDPFSHKIFRFNPLTSGLTILLSGVGHISSISFDSYGNNLYMTDTEYKRVDVYSMATRSVATIYRTYGGDIPESLVVVPEQGVFFLAILRANGTITIAKINMDGTQIVPHIGGDIIHGPKISLAYDKKSQKIYWSDSDADVIESANIDGTDRNVVHVVEGTPVSIAAQNGILLWVKRKSSNLYSFDTATSATDPADQMKIVTKMAIDQEAYLSLAVMGEQESTRFHPCQQLSGGCSHVCLVSYGHQRTCHCPLGMHLSPDNRTCHTPSHCSDSQFKCRRDDICIAKIQRCDGHADCPSGDDESDCDMFNCREDQFKCGNGQCIAAGRKCDGEYDCSDHSDETFCPSNCTNNEFQCGSGECLPMSWRCDYTLDCRDGSDENGCGEVTCGTNQFACKSGTCIPHVWECDGDGDCADGSDEHEGCEAPTCRPDQLTCGNGRCVSKSMICDGADDCGDATDEASCGGSVRCSDGDFFCEVSRSKCVPRTARCNGTAECPRGEDEMDCFRCQQEEFQCKNGRCIYNHWVCDKENDCGDHSDEDPNVCSPVSPTRGVTAQCREFRCKSGECIPMYLVCNEIPNCQDGSDEGSNCSGACAGNPCQQKCLPTPTAHRCACNNGYLLKSDGYSCMDVDECVEQRCSQLCSNSPGGFNCTCLPGYLLKSDRVTCKAEGEPMSYILSDGDEIRKVSHNFHNVELLLYNPGLHISGVEVDTSNRILYWSTGTDHRINAMNINGTDRSFIIGSGQPGKLSFDWVTDNIYYIDDSDYETIKVCNMAEKKFADVVHVEPGFVISSLLFNPITGFLYYAKARPGTLIKPTSRIMQFTASQPNSTILVGSGVSWVSSFAYDHVRQYLYWSDLYHQVIEKVRFDGNDRQIVFKEEVHRPDSLTLFEDHLYWLTKGSGTIRKCQLYGDKKGSCDSIPLFIHDSRFMVILQSARQPKVSNLCRGKCDAYSLCVRTADGPTCICEDGTSLAEGQTCDESHMTLSNEIMMKRSEGNSGLYFGSDKSSSSGSSTVIGVLMTALLVCIAFATYLYVKRRRGKVVLETMHFQNPSFGLSHVPTSYHPSELTPGEHQYENPAGKLVKHPDGKYSVLTRQKEPDTKTSCRLDLQDYESDSDADDHRMDMKANLIP